MGLGPVLSLRVQWRPTGAPDRRVSGGGLSERRVEER
jgi:hypothetical protein